MPLHWALTSTLIPSYAYIWNSDGFQANNLHPPRVLQSARTSSMKPVKVAPAGRNANQRKLLHAEIQLNTAANFAVIDNAQQYLVNMFVLVSLLESL